MKIIPVYLRDMQDAKHLVQAAEACKKEVDLLCGRSLRFISGYYQYLR